MKSEEWIKRRIAHYRMNHPMGQCTLKIIEELLEVLK